MKPPQSLPKFRASSPYICSNCLLARTPKSIRNYTTSTTTFNPPAPPSAGYTHLSSRRLISLSGPDSTKFLQGVITANLTPTPPRDPKKGGFYAAFLNAQGRLLNDVFVYPDTAGIGGEGREGWLIEVDAKEAHGLAKHVKRYKLRAKFDVRVIEEDERRVWSVWDEGSGKEEGSPAHTLSMPISSVETNFEKGILGSLDTRAPGMGCRLLLPGDEKPKVEMEESTEDSYRIRRYLKGVPEGQDELFREHSLPQESNIDFMGGVDYRKGCYVGQELTIRTHHTGVVRKRVLPVMLYRKEGKMPETLEYKAYPDLGVDVNGIPSQTSIGRFEKRGRSAGKWLSGVGNIGLGLCRLETMTGMEVGGEVGGYKEGDEFQLEWNVEGEEKSEIVKIKAFVPSWHLRK